MTLLRSHVVLMAIYALAAALFFSLLWKSGTRERVKFFFFVFLALFLGGIAVGWLMFPFPLR